MRKRLCSLLLCIVLVMTLLPFAASAADSNGITNPDLAKDGTGELNLTKKLIPATDGKYDITMESWATGQVNSYEEKVPTDFVVVVDQSGSMDTNDMPTGNPTVQNGKYLEDIAKGSYFYKDGDNYYRVYGVNDYLYRYYPANYWYVGDLVTRFGTDLGWFMSNEDTETTFENQMYFREVVNGKTYYQPITMSVQGKIGTYYIKFRFDSKQTGTEYWFDREVQTYNGNQDSPWYRNMTNIGDKLIKPGWSVGLGWPNYGTIDGAVQELWRDDNAYTYSEVSILGWRAIHTGMYINYPMYDRHIGYTKLCYRDIDGVEHEVKSNSNNQSKWEFCNDDGQALNGQEGSRPTYSGLYTFADSERRIDALQGALSEFAQTIAKERDSFGAVDNKISIVGFSSEESTYKNTELLTGSTFDIERGNRIPSNDGYSADGYNHNGKMKSEATTADYAGALVSAASDDAGTVNDKITNGINALTAYGGTQPEDGLDMAYQVLANRGENTTYTIRSGDNKGEVVDRNTVVIYFTDGRPGDYKYSNQYSEANDVVESAKKIKDYGAEIFSIGVFGESDGNPLTYDETNLKSPYNNRKYWPYMGGWVESHEDDYGDWHCLRRQWRPGNTAYTEDPNDTIFDYMSVVSSNYPDAKDYIAPTWLTGGFSGNYIAATDGDVVRQKSSAEATNKYYRMASSQDTLVAAFLEATKMNNNESQSGVELNSTAIFKDAVNLNDFDITGATYTVKWQPVKMTATGAKPTDNGTAETKVNGAAVPNDGKIEYTGFDYSANYVTTEKNGYKLVVTINGIKPKRMSSELKSNDGNAGVYGAGSEDATVEIVSPTLNNTDDENAKFYVVERKITSNGEIATGDPKAYSIKDYYDATNKKVSVNLLGKDKEDAPFITNGYLYGGHYNSNYSKPSTVLCTGLEPEIGETFYIKSVDKQYLIARNLLTKYGDELHNTYALAVVDDPYYQEVGFLFNGKPIQSMPDKDDTEDPTKSKLYDSVTVKNLTPKEKLNPSDLLDGTAAPNAKIAVAKLSTGGANGTLQAYWVTPDGVKVTGARLRTLENGRAKTALDNNSASTVTPPDANTTVHYSGPMPVKSIYVANDEEDEPISTDFGVKLAGYTTSLNGNIAMNFYMDVSDDVAADENAYMQFTLPGANTTAEKVMLSDATKQTRDGKTYYVFSAGVAAKEMTSDIKAQFVKGDGTKSPEWTYTIKEYCDYIRAHGEEYDAESIALAENMLLYGGNAQKYFKHNMDKLADADVDLALPEVNLDECFDPVVKGSCEGLTYLGSSAMLTTTTGLRHYFEFAGNAEDYTFTANGKKLKVESDKNGKYVLIDNIKAKDLKKPITLKVTDKAGNEFSLTYSVYTNIKQVISGDFESADKNLMKALYGYGEAANTYFATRG